MKSIVIVSLLALLLLASGKPATAQTWKPGVAGGDCFYYEMYGVYNLSDLDGSLVIPQFEHNNTDWARINVTGVEGSVIYQIYTLHYKNGSELSFNAKTDVNPTGESSLPFPDKGVPICAANLTAGDQVPTNELTINETAVRVYGSGPRETVHVSWNVSNDCGNCYFDRATGMLVDLCRTHKFMNHATGEVVEKTDVIKLTSTSRWQVTTPHQSTTFGFEVLTATILALFSFIIGTYRFVSKKTRHSLAVNRTANYK